MLIAFLTWHFGHEQERQRESCGIGLGPLENAWQRFERYPLIATTISLHVDALKRLFICAMFFFAVFIPCQNCELTVIVLRELELGGPRL